MVQGKVCVCQTLPSAMGNGPRIIWLHTTKYHYGITADGILFCQWVGCACSLLGILLPAPPLAPIRCVWSPGVTLARGGRLCLHKSYYIYKRVTWAFLVAPVIHSAPSSRRARYDEPITFCHDITPQTKTDTSRAPCTHRLAHLPSPHPFPLSSPTPRGAFGLAASLLPGEVGAL